VAQNHQRGPKAKPAFPHLCIYSLTSGLTRTWA